VPHPRRRSEQEAIILRSVQRVLGPPLGGGCPLRPSFLGALGVRCRTFVPRISAIPCRALLLDPTAIRIRSRRFPRAPGNTAAPPQKQTRLAPVSRSEPNLFGTPFPVAVPRQRRGLCYPKRFSADPPSHRKPGAVLLRRVLTSTRTL